MRSSGTNATVRSSTEFCPDCDADYNVDVVAELISATVATLTWECALGHVHEGYAE